MENKPIRILQMTASLYMGGSQSMIMNLYKNIDRERIQFDFIVDHPDLMDFADTIKELGGKIYVMPTFKGINLFEVIKAWNKLFKEHPEYKVIHSHARSYASIYLKIAKKYGVKTIIHSHNTSNGEGFTSLVRNALQLPLRRIADYFFGCSKNAGLWLFGEKIVSDDRFFVLNNAINSEKFKYNEKTRKEYRKEFGIKDDEKVFIQVGELCEQKNYEFTIKYFTKLCKKDNKCKLYIVGSGDLENEISNMIKENKMSNNIIMLGRRTDVNSLLQMADVYIMPSLYEGLSVAAIEAQASGINCLFSNQVNKDVDITKLCKFIPLDEDKWVNASIEALISRKDTSELIKEAGYDIKTTATWLSNFYEKISS